LYDKGGYGKRERYPGKTEAVKLQASKVQELGREINSRLWSFGRGRTIS
jgi:hypothetical protein